MELVSPHLTSVLKTYQHSATRSLHGPGAGAARSPLEREEDSPTPAPPVPVPAPPVLSTADRGLGDRGETLLEGESISCFAVGGEKRLCLPQILTSVLTDFSLDQINRVCDELQIYCSRCTPEQLHELKATSVLPRTAPSCGLITQTDAERLCAALLHRAPPPPPPAGALATARAGFRVYHECFGKCRGVCIPELYISRQSACVECVECRGMFSPQRFVCHAHRDLENRTCHWGFDSSRWRSYMIVAEEQPDKEKCAGLLDEMQSRYERPDSAPQPLLKRKQVLEPLVVCKPEPPESPPKKLKPAEETYGTYVYVDPYVQLQAAAIYDRYRTLAAFRPWSSKRPFLSHEPPALQHPERVVRLADSARFETSYQPNVALKPLTPPSSDEITSSTSPAHAQPLRATSPHACPADAASAILEAERVVAARAARLAAREAKLDEREAELAAREARLAEREAEFARRSTSPPTNSPPQVSPPPLYEEPSPLVCEVPSPAKEHEHRPPPPPSPSPPLPPREPAERKAREDDDGSPAPC